ncbi:MAG: nitroreductase family protein [Eubacteriales bacterium]
MENIFNVPLDVVVTKRKSIRTYTLQPIPKEIKNQLSQYMSALSNPFDVKVSFHDLAVEEAENSKQLGTYGMIKGAKDFIGATVKKVDLSLEALGYEFEKLILYAASIDLGTCWLGGTFNKAGFAKEMEINEGDLFPIVTPIGYFGEKLRFKDFMIRSLAKSDQRKSWEELFFEGTLDNPLSIENAGDYAFALNMVQLAPSASNKQPWRIIKENNMFHFFECKAQGYSGKYDFDMQRIDMGIAACHFHLAAMERDLKGQFSKVNVQVKNIPDNFSYIFSWIIR